MGRDSWPSIVVEQRRARPMRSVARRIAGPARPAPIHREVKQCWTIKRYARHHLGQIDVLTFTRHVAMVKAGEGAHCAVHAAGIIHIRPAPASWWLIGQPGDGGEPCD